MSARESQRDCARRREQQTERSKGYERSNDKRTRETCQNGRETSQTNKGARKRAEKKGGSKKATHQRHERAGGDPEKGSDRDRNGSRQTGTVPTDSPIPLWSEKAPK